MKAALYTRYGRPDVLSVAEIDDPVPQAHEILVRIRAATVTSGDARLRAFNIPPAFWLPARLAFGLTGPRQPVLGSDFAGEVAAIGEEVSRFRIGDRVFGMSLMGSHAEFRVIDQDGSVALIPDNVSYEEAAAITFGGVTALYFLRKAGVRSGHRVLVIGASGATGTAFVQIARHFGADVTGISSTANVELVRSLGASRVVDYTTDDIAESGRVYDIVIDTVGSTNLAEARGYLASDGVFVPVVSGVAEMIQSMTSSGQTVVTGNATETPEAIRTLRDLMESGELHAVIDSRYPLREIVAAHERVDTGRKRGSVVLVMTEAEGQ